jgi:hypothetical protein
VTCSGLTLLSVSTLYEEVTKICKGLLPLIPMGMQIGIGRGVRTGITAICATLLYQILTCECVCLSFSKRVTSLLSSEEGHVWLWCCVQEHFDNLTGQPVQGVRDVISILYMGCIHPSGFKSDQLQLSI